MGDEWYSENGREYHIYQRGTYQYPHDERERERFDLLHNLFYQSECGIGLDLPLARPARDRPLRGLDIGCGTGFWVIEMADKYPDSLMVGWDLANIQPPTIPSNSRFDIPRNFEAPWTCAENSWDIIHLSMLNGSVSNYHELYATVFRHLRPGVGHIEHLEIDMEPRADDGSLREAPALLEWYALMTEASRRTGKPIAYNHDTQSYLERQGFVDITHRVIMVPYHRWPRDSSQAIRGDIYQVSLNQVSGLEAFSLQLFQRVFHWSRDRIEDFTNRVRQEIMLMRLHAYNNIHVWSARKPVQ